MAGAKVITFGQAPGKNLSKYGTGIKNTCQGLLTGLLPQIRQGICCALNQVLQGIAFNPTRLA